MDLSWQCVEVREVADVVDWRSPGDLGAAELGVSWFENAESRVTDGCVEPCSPTNDCFAGQCTGPDGSTVVYRQDIVGEGANVATTTSIDVYPVDGTAWDRLTVTFTDTRSDDGTTAAHTEAWTVSWEGLLVPEWPQDASFVASRESASHFGNTVETASESWLDRDCTWSSLRSTGIDSTTWSIEMGSHEVGVMDAVTNCATAASATVDGADAGYVDADTWASVGDTCPAETADDTGTPAPPASEGCGCATGGRTLSWFGLGGLLAAALRRRTPTTRP